MAAATIAGLTVGLAHGLGRRNRLRRHAQPRPLRGELRRRRARQRIGGARQQPRQQRLAVHLWGGVKWVQAGQRQQRRRDIDIAADLRELPPRRNARSPDHHGDADRMVVHVELARGQVVLPQVVCANHPRRQQRKQRKHRRGGVRTTVIRRNEEVGGVPELELLQGVGDACDRIVHREQSLPALPKLEVNRALLVREQRPLRCDHRVVVLQHGRIDGESRGARR